MNRILTAILAFAFSIIAGVAFADSLYNIYKNKVKGTRQEKNSHLSLTSDLPQAPPPVISEHDLITIIIDETAVGSGSASHEVDRSTDANFDVNKWFQINKGLKTSIPDTLPEADVTSEWKSEGKGSSSRKSSIRSKIRVMVKQVYPNGNLLIEGRSSHTIGTDDNQIIVTGIIQTSDVTQNKTVTSSMVYDLRVVYTGTGFSSDAANPGWMTRFVNRFWPF